MNKCCCAYWIFGPKGSLYAVVAKEIELPFTPVVGMTLDLTEGEDYDRDTFEVQQIRWIHKEQMFCLDQEHYVRSPEDQPLVSTVLEPETPKGLLDLFMKDGWVVQEPGFMSRKKRRT